MSAGSSSSEVGPDPDPAGPSPAGHGAAGSHRLVSIVEAVLLASVALLAAWSGYSSAKWSTESRLEVAQAATARTEASRAKADAGATKSFDASTFEAWFTAYVAGNQQAMAIAERRFRPEFKVAFDAWMATDPATNPQAPPGPTYVPEYVQPDLQRADELDAKADERYRSGAEAAGHADDYVRITVYLATVLFLVGISGHFSLRSARIGLVVVGGAILAYGVVLLVAAPKPPM